MPPEPATLVPAATQFPHGADIGVRGVGATRAAALEQIARALAAAVVDPDAVRETEEIAIDCAAPDDRLLLCDWLNAVIYEMAVRRMVFRRFAVRLSGFTLHARAWGEPLDPARHAPALEPKGATMTGLRVAPHDGGWIAECIVDV